MIVRHGWVTVPDAQDEGVIPTCDAAFFPEVTWDPSPRWARTIGAVIGPIPRMDSSSGSAPQRASHGLVAAPAAPSRTTWAGGTRAG